MSTLSSSSSSSKKKKKKKERRETEIKTTHEFISISELTECVPVHKRQFLFALVCSVAHTTIGIDTETESEGFRTHCPPE